MNTIDKYSLINKIYNSWSSGKFIVLGISEKQNSPKKTTQYDIKFLNTGIVRCGIRKDAIISGSVRDLYKPSLNFHSKACPGNPFKGLLTIIQYESLRQVWLHMLERCYNPNVKSYRFYGAKGIYVCNRWLCFEYFLEDVQKLKNWDKKFNNWNFYSLDKDINSNRPKDKYYSLQNCQWATKKEQNEHRRHIAKFIATTPSGNQIKGENLTQFAEKYNLTKNCISRCLLGKSKTHFGWTFKRV